MSTVSVQEPTIESDWKVLASATQKACEEERFLRQRKNRPSKSYEQFVEEIKRNKSNHNSASIDYFGDDTTASDKNDSFAKHNNNDVRTQEDIYLLGDWKSDDEECCNDERSNSDSRRKYKPENKTNKKLKGILKYRHHLSKIHETPEDKVLYKSSSTSSSDSEENANIKNNEKTGVYSQDESSWESVSGSSEDDANFDEFLKSTKDPSRKESDSSICTDYTNLTECLLNNYYPEAENILNNNQSSQDPNTQKNTEDQQQYEDFQERLPFMQVLDTLNDVGNVLKAGKITPRMERILEYKQEYPFSEGYEEEVWGWCPWLVYKFERLCKRIRDKQWPY